MTNMTDMTDPGEPTGPADPVVDEYARRASRTYSSAADHYDKPALGFWDRFGTQTVARLGLAPGQTVLDLCCGAGASAIPAAQAIGPDGRVLGVDVAAPLLALARARAARLGLSHIQFHCADARRTGFASGSFDAVICVFGVFFVADMTAFIAEMWRLVRPGGALAITTWGPGLFEPANGIFWRAVQDVEPALYKAFHPWDKITSPDALQELFARAGIPDSQIIATSGNHRLDRPQDFWDVVLGSGYRATTDALSDQQRYTLRQAVLHTLEEDRVTAIRTDVIFATATRPR